MTTSTSRPRSIVRRLWDALLALIRLLLAIALGILVGVALWYAGLLGYRTVVEPLNATILRVDALERLVDAEQSELRSRLAERDGQLAALQRRQSAQQAEIDRLDALDANLGVLAGDVDALLERSGEIDDALGGAADRVDALDASLAALETGDARQTEQLDALDESLATAREELAAAEAELAGLRRGALILQAQANVLNAQQSLARRDIGQTTDYLDRARVYLESAVALDEDEDETLTAALGQLARAQDRLEDDPFSAEGDLVALWRGLDGAARAALPIVPASRGDFLFPTPTPAATDTTATPSSTPGTATPTATPTVTPTATPTP